MIKNSLGRLEMHPLPPVKKAKITIIGEFPNVEELRAGKYFISDGADALNRTLQKFNIKLEDCYYTVACTYLMSKKNKTIPAQRRIEERARLIKEIKESGSKIVLPLGTMATSLLMDSKSMTITKVLGNVLETPDLPNVKIVPNYHPALLLHSPGNYKIFQNVIDCVAQLYFDKPRDPGKTVWEWVETEVGIKALIAEVKDKPYIAADIETSSLNCQVAEIWTFGIATAKNKVKVISHEAVKTYPELITNLLSQPCKWIWHGGKYDTKVFWWKNFLAARLDEDTMYTHYCLNETSGTHGLGICATVYLGADEYKSKMNSEFANITDVAAYNKMKQDLGERVAIDADYTFQLFEVLKPQVESNPDLKKLYDRILIPAGNWLRKVEMRGMKVDVPYLESRVPHYNKQIEELTALVQEAAAPFWNPEVYKAQTGAKTASDVFKPTSVKQLAWLMYDKLKLKPTLRGALRKRGTGEEVLLSIPNPPEFILKILDLRKVKKEYSTYVKSYLTVKDENDIVHPTFNLHITATGRLSCTDPNVQNVPSNKPDVRDAFIARGKDRILMEVDYSGAELRVLAFVSKDKALTEALTNGDPHGELAAKIFGTEYTEGDSATMKELRGRAKTVNFGVAYGRGAKDISESFSVSVEEATRWIVTWSEMYPDAWAYLQSCADAVRNGECLVTIYGRHRRLGLIHQGNVNDLINEAKNFRIQSISSDNCVIAGMTADEYLEKEYDALIVNDIHDSLLIDCPADPETVKAVATYMANTMISIPIKEYNCTVPFASDVDLGYRWGTFAAYNRETGEVEYKKKTYRYEDWIRTQGVEI